MIFIKKCMKLLLRITIQTIDLDPPGGSENFHEGPGGWTSGNGREQFYE